jgi:hypothetical protein
MFVERAVYQFEADPDVSASDLEDPAGSAVFADMSRFATQPRLTAYSGPAYCR